MLLRGAFRDRLVGPCRPPVEGPWRPNLVVWSALDLIGLLLCSRTQGVTFLAVGAGDPAWDDEAPKPDKSRTGLENELYRVRLDPGAALAYDPANGELQVHASIGPGKATGTLRELGLFGGDASPRPGSGTLVNHAVHPALQKGAGDTLERDLVLTLEEALPAGARELVGRLLAREPGLAGLTHVALGTGAGALVRPGADARRGGLPEAARPAPARLRRGGAHRRGERDLRDRGGPGRRARSRPVRRHRLRRRGHRPPRRARHGDAGRPAGAEAARAAVPARPGRADGHRRARARRRDARGGARGPRCRRPAARAGLDARDGRRAARHRARAGAGSGDGRQRGSARDTRRRDPDRHRAGARRGAGGPGPRVARAARPDGAGRRARRAAERGAVRDGARRIAPARGPRPEGNRGRAHGRGADPRPRPRSARPHAGRRGGGPRRRRADPRPRAPADPGERCEPGLDRRPVARPADGRAGRDGGADHGRDTVDGRDPRPGGDDARRRRRGPRRGGGRSDRDARACRRRWRG